MLTINDLKRRRNEWLEDDGRWSMLDANNCIHSISRCYAPDFASFSWVVAWALDDSPCRIPQIAGHTYVSLEDAKAWVDKAFADHFEWFDPEEGA